MDRRLKDEFLDKLRGQAYDLLQLWEYRILTNEFRIRLWDSNVPPPLEEVAAAREKVALLQPGLRRGLHSGGPVADLSLPSRAIEYKEYRRRHVSSSSSGSDAWDSESGGEAPPSTYTHTAAFQHRTTLWSADGVLHVRVPLELHFLEAECLKTKTLLRSAVVKTTGKWQQGVLQHAKRT